LTAWWPLIFSSFERLVGPAAAEKRSELAVLHGGEDTSGVLDIMVFARSARGRIDRGRKPPGDLSLLEKADMSTRVLCCLVLVSIHGVPRTVVAQEELGKKQREKIKIEWAQYEAKNYAAEYESVIPLSTVKQVCEGMEEALAQYVTVFKFAPKEKFKVKFLESLNTYEQEGGDPSHPGYFNPGSGYLVIRQLPFYNLMPTVYHEAFHQYLEAYMGKGAPIPTWYNEGLAMYYEGMQKSRQTKKLDYKLIDNRKIGRLKEAIFTRSALPLQKLVDATHAEFHEKEKEELYYSQSFAFMYFLMQGLGGKQVLEFAKELKKSKDVSLADDKIFGKKRKSLGAIEKKWKEYVLGLKLEEPKP
jgi:hypothetical protein